MLAQPILYASKNQSPQQPARVFAEVASGGRMGYSRPSLERMRIVLSIVGKHLDPALVSGRLGGQPRKSGKRGDPIAAKDDMAKPVSRPALAGFWQRGLSLRDSIKPDAAIQDLLAGLTNDAATWQQLGLEFRTEIAVHGVPAQMTPQDLFSQDTLALLRERGLQVVLRAK
jgi:hypothetical protein